MNERNPRQDKQNLLTAERADSLQRVRKQNYLNRRLVKAHQDGRLTEQGIIPEAANDGEETMDEDIMDDTVQVGDNDNRVTHNHYQQPSGVNQILPWLLAAAGVAGPLGYFVATALTPRPTPNVTQPGEDRDTVGEIGFTEPTNPDWIKKGQ